MKCIKCDEQASAVCQFCGRAVCKEHIQHKRFVSGYTSFGGILSPTDNAFSVEDAVWCGACQPKYERSN